LEKLSSAIGRNPMQHHSGDQDQRAGLLLLNYTHTYTHALTRSVWTI